MALFTGKGDGGQTRAFDCDQYWMSKASERPEALGAVDELNAVLGLARVKAGENARVAGALRDAQETLFIIQAEIAGAQKSVKEGSVAAVERIVNDIEKEIPPITDFSIPGGSELSALLDVARTVSRRAERRVIAALETGACKVSNETRAYLNRLSSLLFALARLANHEAGVADEHPRY